MAERFPGRGAGGGAPADQRLYRLARVLRDALPVLQDRKLANAVRLLLAEAKKPKPNRRNLFLAQDSAVAALAAMVASCTSGALGLLLLEELEGRQRGTRRPPPCRRGLLGLLDGLPLDPRAVCVALALAEALPLLPVHEDLATAAAALIAEAEKSSIDPMELFWAWHDGHEALTNVVGLHGSALAELLLEWLDNRPF